MNKHLAVILKVMPLAGIFVSCSQKDISSFKEKIDYKTNWQRIRYHIKQQRNYKNSSLSLARENRKLRIKSNKMIFEIQELKAEIALLKNQHRSDKKWNRSTKKPGRKIASESQTMQISENRLKTEQAFLLARNEYKRKNYPKAFEYFQSFAQKFPQHKKIDDRFLYRIGLAGFETQHYNQADRYFQQLIDTHPKSKLYRSSKLWVGLCHLKMGNKNKFIQTVKEFKDKYQNTPEWKVLRVYYEKIIRQQS